MKFISRVVLMFLGSIVLMLMQSPLTPIASANSLHPNTKSSQSTTRSSCLQPSHNINLMTLSDSALMALGLPSQEVIHQNPAHWSDIFSHLGSRSCGLGHPLNLQNNIEEHHSISPRAIGDGCNANSGSKCENEFWTGNLAIGKGRGVYKSADLTMAVPTISKSPSNAKVAYWAGVGGDGFITSNAVLVQAGVISWVSGNTQVNESVVEVANNVDYYNLPLCRLAAGDKIEAYVESNIGNDGYDWFWMINQSANYCYNSCYVHTDNTSIQDTCGFSGGSSFNSDSTSGECIVERVGGQSGYPLAEFNPSNNVVQMQNCLVNQTGVGAQTHNYMVIENNSSQQLAGPGSIASDKSSFPVVWHRGS